MGCFSNRSSRGCRMLCHWAHDLEEGKNAICQTDPSARCALSEHKPAEQEAHKRGSQCKNIIELCLSRALNYPRRKNQVWKP